MIYEKMAIMLEDFTQQKKEQPSPDSWYDLVNLFWDIDEKTAFSSFLLFPDTLKFVIDLFSNNDKLLYLWFDFKKDIEYDTYERYTRFIPNTQIQKIRIVTKAWGGNYYFLPECTIYFKYKNFIDSKNNLHYNLNINKGAKEFLDKDGCYEIFLMAGNYSLKIEDFDLIINLDKNLFPIEFMVTKNFENINDRDVFIDYFNNDNNKKNNILFFKMEIDQHIYSIYIDNCHIDYILKDKNIDNYQNIKNNLVIYGGADEKSKISFNNSNDIVLISLEEYIKKNPLMPTIMKDKFGDIAIEL